MTTGDESQPPPGFDFSPRNVYPERQRVEADLLRRKQELEEKKGELERSIETMRAAMGAFPDGILVTNAKGQITSFNPKLLQMWGIPAEVIDGKEPLAFLEAVSPRLCCSDQLAEAIDGVPVGDLSETHHLLRLVDGRTIDSSSSVHMVSGESVGRVWVFRDVTDSQKAIGNLEARCAFDATILDLASTGILVVDADLVLTYVNAKTKALLGRSEPVGQRIVDAMKGVWPPDWVDPFVDLLQETLHPGKPARAQIGFEVEGHGGRYDCDIQRTTLPGGESAVVCYIGTPNA